MHMTYYQNGSSPKRSAISSSWNATTTKWMLQNAPYKPSRTTLSVPLPQQTFSFPSNSGIASLQKSKLCWICSIDHELIRLSCHTRHSTDHMIGINSLLLPQDAKLSSMNLLPTEDHGAVLVQMDGTSARPWTITAVAITLCPRHGCIKFLAQPHYSSNTAKFHASRGRSNLRECQTKWSQHCKQWHQGNNGASLPWYAVSLLPKEFPLLLHWCTCTLSTSGSYLVTIPNVPPALMQSTPRNKGWLTFPGNKRWLRSPPYDALQMRLPSWQPQIRPKNRHWKIWSKHIYVWHATTSLAVSQKSLTPSQVFPS